MRRIITIIIPVAMLMLAAGIGSVQAAKPVLLKVPVAFSTTLPGLGTTIKWVGDRIATLSDGAVRMKIYQPGKLVAPGQILDAVSRGKVNAGYATAAFWSSRIPASPLFSAVPFGPRASEYLAWLWYGNGMKLYQQMYDQAGYQVKVQVCGMTAPETAGWYTSAIDTPDQLKGLKVRFPGLGGQVLRKLGVSTQQVSGAAVISELQNKTISGARFSMPAIDELLAFHEVAAYNYFPGWHQQATIYELLINRDTWKRMDKSQQMAVTIMCRAAVAESLAYTDAIQAAPMTENSAAHGVENRYWSREMLDLFAAAWAEVVAEQSARDAYFDKVWRDLSAFRSDYRVWGSRAFLPQPDSTP